MVEQSNKILRRNDLKLSLSITIDSKRNKSHVFHVWRNFKLKFQKSIEISQKTSHCDYLGYI